MEGRSVRRRGGKPNRGGGKYNRGGGGSSRGSARGRGDGQGRGSDRGGFDRGGPHRGRGGNRGRPQRGRGAPPPQNRGGGGWSSSRKGGASYDYDDLMDGPVVNDPYYNPPVQNKCYDPTPAPVKPKPRVKVEMQGLFMSSENQALVRDTLLSLRMEDAAVYSDEEEVHDFGYQDYEDNDYDELDYRAEDQYWMTDRNLVVEGGTSNALSSSARAGGGNPSISLPNPYAITKLQRCGFSHELCLEALQICDGDTGAALEYLLNDLYDITYQEMEADEVDEDLINAREDEKMALESIYDTAFDERIPGKVWVLDLELTEVMQTLNRLYPAIKPNAKRKDADKKGNKKLCPFFLKGKCRFNDKCRLSHTTPDEEPKDLSHPIYNKFKEVEGEKIPPPFSIEIRFPIGNRYPEEAPLIAFSSGIEHFPPHIKLNLSLFLMEQAKDAALDHLPCVFTLVSSLEDTLKLEELFSLPAPSYSTPASTQTNVSSASKENKSNLENGSSYKLKDISKEVVPKESVVEKGVDKVDSSNSFEHLKKSQRNDFAPNVDPSQVKSVNSLLQVDFKRKQKSKVYLNMQVTRQGLPAWEMRELINEVIADNQVVVICGMTGCGKTTQVPQFILDDALQQKEFNANIICTQPRRISAMAVAQRVADERSEKLGKSVGYKIRLESVASSHTRLLFCTTGIILRRLESDPRLEGVSHIIIDEVHERSEESDFLLMILRDVLAVRSDLKVILMSATLNAQLFSDYFSGCPVLEIPGRTFPVQQFFIEDAIEFTKYAIEDKSPYAKSMKKSGIPQFAKGFDDLDEEELEHVMDSTKGPAKDKVGDMALTLSQVKMRYEGYSNATHKALNRMDMEKINYDLMVEILEWIVSERNHFEVEGAILVFMPGFAEIQTLYDAILATSEFGRKNRQRYKVIPLHSTLSSEDQNAVFQRPKEGVIKIVIATNIAETSITIDDVVYVLDAGRMKEKRYDQTKSMESLETVWVSRANALQRQGRAGRVQEGVCFHFFTSHHFDHHLKHQPIPGGYFTVLSRADNKTLAKMIVSKMKSGALIDKRLTDKSQTTAAEIQRAPLEQLVLKIRILPAFREHAVETVLESLIEAPSKEAISGAIKRLQDLGALDKFGELNALGYHLGYLPVDVRIGKLMLYGAIFRCVDSALTIAAALSFKSPFVSPFGLKQEADEKKKEFAMGHSDYLTILNAYKSWIEVRKRGSHHAYNFCKDNFLSVKTLQMLASLKQQYVELLSDIGFIRPGIRLRDVERAGKGSSDGVSEIVGMEGNVNTDNWRLMSAMLVAALYPNIVQVLTPETRYHESSAGAVQKAPKAEELKFKTKLDGYVFIHPSSVNFHESHYPSPYLVYHEKVKTTKVYIRDCSMVSVYQLLLFGGGSIGIDLYQGTLIMSVCDNWIQFKASSPQIAELLRDLRQELDQLLSDKISDPGLDLLTCPRGSKIINCIVSLVTSQ